MLEFRVCKNMNGMLPNQRLIKRNWLSKENSSSKKPRRESREKSSERKCKSRIEPRCRGNAKKKKRLNVLKNSE